MAASMEYQQSDTPRALTPMEIRPLRADDGMLIKRVRLRSLVDAPYAFGLRSFEEAALPDSHGHQLATQVGGQAPEWRDRCVSYVVLDGDDARGTATCFLFPTCSIGGGSWLVA